MRKCGSECRCLIVETIADRSGGFRDGLHPRVSFCGKPGRGANAVTQIVPRRARWGGGCLSPRCAFRIADAGSNYADLGQSSRSYVQTGFTFYARLTAKCRRRHRPDLGVRQSWRRLGASAAWRRRAGTGVIIAFPKLPTVKTNSATGRSNAESRYNPRRFGQGSARARLVPRSLSGHRLQLNIGANTKLTRGTANIEIYAGISVRFSRRGAAAGHRNAPSVNFPPILDVGGASRLSTAMGHSRAAAKSAPGE